MLLRDVQGSVSSIVILITLKERFQGACLQNLYLVPKLLQLATMPLVVIVVRRI